MRRIVLVAVVAGVLAGGAVAAATGGGDATGTIARTGGAQSGGAPAAQAGRRVVDGPLLRRPGRMADGRFDPGYSRLVAERGTLRIDVRREDPDGGPAWAVRTFDAERRTLKQPARTLDRPAWRAAVRCAELGRVRRGRFGWLFPGGRFRPTTPGAIDRMLQCGSRTRPQALAVLETVLDFPSPSEPRITGTVLWGVAPPGTRRVVAVAAPSGERELPTGSAGAFLHLPGRDTRAHSAAVRFETAEGRTVRRFAPRGSAPRRPPGDPATRRRPVPIPGTERLETRAPDPAGGPGWGIMVADATDGSVCVAQEGQFVEDRVGGIDATLGLFWEAITRPGACRRYSPPPTRRRPLLVSYGGGSVPEEERSPLLRRARRERRLLPGRFDIRIDCHPDVEQVTIRTPRDIRTLVPSPRAHIVFALYDGSFPAGEIVFTATLKGGGRYTERIPVAF